MNLNSVVLSKVAMSRVALGLPLVIYDNLGNRINFDKTGSIQLYNKVKLFLVR